MATKSRYPTGVRPLLTGETARRRRIESRFVDAFASAGFEEVVLPIIDYVEPYAALVAPATAKQSYRFVDREGDLIAIRSDFTPMLARALAPSINPEELPLRLFYRGDVIRVEASRLGANRELFQIGAEIVGDDSIDADVAMLRLAADLVRAPRDEPSAEPTIVYNDVSIATALIAQAGAVSAPGAKWLTSRTPIRWGRNGCSVALMRVIWQIVGFVMLLAGLALTITPIPFSTLIAVLGLSLIIANNHVVARWMRAWRMRSPAFDRAFEWIERMLPKTWRVDGGSVFEDFSNSRHTPD